MDDKIFDRIQDVDLQKTMENSYIDYAMSVIASRALPDVRDGLKPVQRRILYAMSELGNSPDKPHRKCARIVGDTMGKYHPHGDSSIYGSLVNMAQPWSMRYTLVDGHGNFGSVDGDGAAAMRYTEARLTKISMEMLADIGKNTVEFVPNFDETEKEPSVLPCRFPNLLVNGTTGIAVGMATNIPPHNLREESDREGMRVVIELRHDANPNIVLNHLFKHTQLQDTFGITMLALVNNQPKIMNILDMLLHYLRHQEDVVTRRTKYDLGKAEERDHILQGLLIALDNIDEVVQIIRESANVQEARNRLTERFGLDDVQSQAIVDMRLRALTGLEREKLENEHEELLRRIEELKGILADEKKLLAVIRKEMNDIADRFGDDRRSRIETFISEIEAEDLIPNVNTVIAMTSLGYIKRMTVDNFKVQNRGGRGIKGMQKLENDYIEDLLMTRTHDFILFFTNKGRVYKMKAYKIPESGRTSRGTAIINLLELNPGEKVTAIIPLLHYDENNNLFMVTRSGIIKKTAITDFANINKKGINAIHLREDDELIEVKQTNSKDEIFLVTRMGMCIHFMETEVRKMGRSATGVYGIKLREGDAVIGMQISSQGDSLLLVSENGIGKRTPLSEFRMQKRGGYGLKSYRITEKTGYLVGVKAVTDEHEIMMINSDGIIIQIRACDVSTNGRYASGVKLMNLNDGAKVVQIAKVRDSGEEGEEFAGNDTDAEENTIKEDQN